jgi:hypothetical protein
MYSLLSLVFNLSIVKVSSTISDVWPLLWETLAPEVSWSFLAEWNSLRGTWETYLMELALLMVHYMRYTSPLLSLNFNLCVIML